MRNTEKKQATLTLTVPFWPLVIEKLLSIVKLEMPMAPLSGFSGLHQRGRRIPDSEN